MDLEPNPRQSVKKINLFSTHVFKKALFQQNIKPQGYEALPEERQNAYSIPGGKCDDSNKRNTATCTEPQEVRLHVIHLLFEGRSSIMYSSPDVCQS